jgi:Ca2+/Na+ antiporter
MKSANLITDEKIIHLLTDNLTILFCISSVVYLIMYWNFTKNKHTLFMGKTFQKILRSIFFVLFLVGGFIYLMTEYLTLSNYKVYIPYVVYLIFIGTIIYRKTNSNKKEKNKTVTKQSNLNEITSKIDVEKVRKNFQDKKFYNDLMKEFGKKSKDVKFNIKKTERDRIKEENIWVKVEKSIDNVIVNKTILTSFYLRYKLLEKQSKTTYINKLSDVHLGIIDSINNVNLYIKDIQKNKTFNSKINKLKKTLETKKLSRFVVDKFLFDEFKITSFSKKIVVDGVETNSDFFKLHISNLYLVAKNNLDEELLGACQILLMSKTHPFGSVYFSLFEAENDTPLPKGRGF